MSVPDQKQSNTQKVISALHGASGGIKILASSYEASHGQWPDGVDEILLGISEALSIMEAKQ